MTGAAHQERTLARAALGPFPLALLAAGGVAGAVVAWPLAIAGVAGYLGLVALTARRRRPASTRPTLRPPAATRLAIRSTEVMALVVRLRKADQACYRALKAADPSALEILRGAYDRARELIEHAHALAARADELRIHLDAAAVAGGPPGAIAQARGDLEAEYREALAEIERAAVTVEQWHARLLHMNVDASGVAELTTREVAEELERVHRVMRELDQVTRS